ncbi:MAG: transcription elongation factor GreA [Peptococcaceae bacterium]|jgi:transcription elongation factor GreA|nr:transcription elongation factor GreA [Peptococcaceae bacterium]
MKEKEVLLTVGGLKKLEGELDRLKSVRRREVAERIKQAIEFGDITENSEYEDAKNEQAFIEGQILTLEKTLRNARVIDDENLGTDVVQVGSAVRLKDMDSGEEETYTIVGSVEADPLACRISNESPVGKAILGQGKGQVVEVKVPAGVFHYQITDITGREVHVPPGQDTARG